MPAKVISVNISDTSGKPKVPVAEVVLDECGVVGDCHRGPGSRQVSLLSSEIVRDFSAEAGRTFKPGEFAENITTEGLDTSLLASLDMLRVGEAELEVTQFGKECHGDSCEIFREVGKCIMPDEGVFCRVLRGGRVRPGDEIVHLPRPLRFRIITLSERASRGEYEDRSGPRIEAIVEQFFGDKRWRLEVDRQVMGDDARRLEKALRAAKGAGIAVVVTTGGTGVGPRDITPDVVMAVADKTIPGIMEGIRAKFGASNPRALLSRSVAAVMGETLVYCVPGSVRAVEEYMPEILRTLEHLVFMLRGIDTH